MNIIKVTIMMPKEPSFLDLVMREINNCYLKHNGGLKNFAKDGDSKPTYDKNELNSAFTTMLGKLGWVHFDEIADAFKTIERGGKVSDAFLALGENILGADNPIIKTYKEKNNMSKDNEIPCPTDEEFENAKSALVAEYGNNFKSEIEEGIKMLKEGKPVSACVLEYAKTVIGTDNAVIKYAEYLLTK